MSITKCQLFTRDIIIPPYNSFLEFRKTGRIEIGRKFVTRHWYPFLNIDMVRVENNENNIHTYFI